ncbi:MAG TPA: beta-galactosidase [Opitutaceae bacterium]|nr:beta-galactosidase [Opitutaceae bacterium]
MKPLWLPLLCGCAAIALRAQPVPDPFPAADLMRIGVYYYPEAWPRQQWPRDIANIKKLGLEFVHLGEFAWAFDEPEEGKYDFAWLDQAVKLCADQGLKVVLCTPSATPPVWLSQRHPEILMIDAKGRRMMHGTREQANWSSEVYRSYVGKIVEQLGRRYGGNPAVWGWQLDNELSHYGAGIDYSDASQQKFRAWLKKKYGTIGALNEAWGASFWSQLYQNFDQIRLPNEEEEVAQLNPHAQLDAERWFADEAADYYRFQAGILRRYTGRRQWITTNFMQTYMSVDPARSAKDLEILTWNLYPAHGNLNEGPLGFRLGSASAISWVHDYLRSLNGNEGLMELQPGQVNWGPVNPQPYPGAIHLWILRAFAAGAKLQCTYRFREPLAGTELYHSGLVGTDGVTPTSGGEQFSQAAREMELLRRNYRPEAAVPAAYAARRTAILTSFDSRWDIENHKQTVRWDTMDHALKYYRALKRLGCPTDVITEDKDFGAYPFLVVPADQLVDAALVGRWRAYAENGGHLILTCRTGEKDRRGHLWEGPWAQPILGLIGAKIKFYDVLPAPHSGRVASGGKTYPWVSWGEVLAPDPGTEPLAQYADQFYAGGVAAVTRALGRGTVTYVGVDSQDGSLEAALVRGVFERARVPVENYDDGLLVDWRDGFWVATNFTEKTERIPIPAGDRVFAGGPVLGPAGVAVWADPASRR